MVIKFTNGADAKYFNAVLSGVFFDDPNAPSGLTAKAISKSEVVLNWVNNSANAISIERSRSATTGFAEIATTTALGYTDTGLVAGTTYYYLVRAKLDTGGYGPYSNTASAKTLRK